MKTVVLARSTSEAIKPMKYHDHLRYFIGTGPTFKSAMDVNFERQLVYQDHFDRSLELAQPPSRRWTSSVE
jgi:hypothetical protein